LDKPRPLMTATERSRVESHVRRSREIMESIPGTPSDVIQMIYEHHEDEIQQGYPNGTPRARLHPLSKILHVADEFVTRAIRSPANPEASPAVALAHLETFELDRINKLAFEALRKVIHAKKAA
jgi:HD-GYP domain-containing protein (c-di-GMP phosphodiesterase class II)